MRFILLTIIVILSGCAPHRGNFEQQCVLMGMQQKYEVSEIQRICESKKD